MRLFKAFAAVGLGAATAIAGMVPAAPVFAEGEIVIGASLGRTGRYSTTFVFFMLVVTLFIAYLPTISTAFLPEIYK